MKKRHPNHRHVKIHRNYAVEEAASVCGVHKNTVREWIKAGLPTIGNKRPILILGSDLASFLQARRASKRQPCRLGELYCVRCRKPRPPAGGMLDYAAVTDAFGNLKAICPVCEAMMNRRISLDKLEQFLEILHVALPEGLRQLNESEQPSLNSDFNKENQKCQNTTPIMNASNASTFTI